jgi:tRNA A-37 threonylcarbamoyl transferase component Bud32
MSTASLPGTSDYREAVQNPHLFLADPELKRCKPALNKQGLPLVWSGGFAAVFQLQSPDGSKFAIKCFYRDIRNLETRYAEFDNHLRSRRPGYLVRFQYQPQGILVNGQWFPIVRMEWVEGQRLDEFLQHHLQRPGPQTRELLEAMAQLWHRLAGELERDRLAHGDLQHGNVLFIPGNRPNSVKLRLVDYDGVWVPALDTLPSNESGQPNYQHPQRRYGPLMDRFPHLVIYTTLRCLMLDQQLARRFSDQRLVFGQEDYAQPGRSELFRELWKNCREPNTRNLVGHLILACVQPFEQTPRLQELVPDAATGWVRPLTALQQGQVEEVLRNGSLSPQSSATSVSFASSTASLPGTSDYREAVQNPHLFLGDPELKRCKPALNKQGLPLVWSGGFAAVFQLQSPDGSKFAIKCFYRDIRNLETRYAEFDKHLSSRRPGYLVRFQYQPRGILVNGQWFPIVRMEWVEGQRLDEFLQHHLQRPGPQTRELLEAMAQLWHRLASELERDRLAHGDLQHGNVLFIPATGPTASSLRLVDYDGVWVPALDTLPSNESGQPTISTRSDVTATHGPLSPPGHLHTLRCLMLDQQLARHFSDQRLVFGQEDYAQPGRSELFRELWKNCRELNTRNLVGHLILACVQPF